MNRPIVWRAPMVISRISAAVVTNSHGKRLVAEDEFILTVFRAAYRGDNLRVDTPI